MERDNLTPQQLKSLLERVIEEAENPEDGINPDVLSLILKNIAFFHKNLEHPANLHDFVELAKHQLNYEVHPYGTVLFKETDYADKLCIILKGNVLKLHQRPYEELEKEIRKKNPEAFKEVLTNKVTIQKQKTKAVDPGYLRHTKSTAKKIGAAKIIYPVTLNKVNTEGSDQSPHGNDMKSRTFNDLGDDSIESDHSLGEADWDQYLLNVELNSREEIQGESAQKVSKLKRLNTIKANGVHKKGVTFKTPIPTKLSVDEYDSDEYDEEKIETKRNKEKTKKEKLEDFKITEDDVILFKKIVARYPDLKGRFFIADILRLQKVRNYKAGEYFAENFYKENRPRELSLSVVSSPEVHLITLTRETYQDIMDEIIQQARDKADFFIELFPSFDVETIKRFSYHFSEKHFTKNEVIYNQNDRVYTLYLLKEGALKLMKEIDYPTQPQNSSSKKHEKIELPIATIMKQQFFGEEILLKESRRLYTVTSTTVGTTVYFIGSQEYHENLRGNFEDVLKVLKHQAQERFDWRQQRVLSLLEQKLITKTKSPQPSMLTLEKSKSDSSIPVFLDYSKRQEHYKHLKPLNDTKFSSPINETPTTVKNTKSTIFTDSENAKNWEIYKAKFSRKAKVSDKSILEEKPSLKKLDDKSLMSPVEPQVKVGFMGFNIRRELSEKKNLKLKLPAINSPRNLSLGRGGAQTTRNNVNLKEMFKREQSHKQLLQTSILDQTQIETIEQIPPMQDKIGKLKEAIYPSEKNIPCGIQNLIKRIENNKASVMSPRSQLVAEKKEERLPTWGEALNQHTKPKPKAPQNLPKNYRAKRNISEDLKGKYDDLSPIVGKKRELLVKAKQSERIVF